MIKRIIIIASALGLALALALTALAMIPEEKTGDEPFQTLETEPGNEPLQILETEPGSVPLYQTSEMKTAADITLNTTDHIAYIQGAGQGIFSPDSYITRGEAAVILYRLLSGTAPVTVSYTDVPESSWYAQAAGQLGSLGVIRPNESTFNGAEAISRAEFASYIACFFPMRDDAEQFPDVSPDHPYADSILSGRAWGWLVGLPNGSFGPEDTIHRSEAVTIINRALGRTGDQASITANRPALFLDVPVNEWYYYEVMEATAPHTFTVSKTGAEQWTSSTRADTGLPGDFQTEGFHLHQGWCYYYSADTGDICRSTTVSGFTFDAGGHFTTGDAWVDEQLRQIVLSQTNSSMTREEMLQAFFAYCRDNFKYLKWNVYQVGDTSFTLAAARQMLSTGRGNCYCYASVFWYLARWLGYDAKIYSGTVYGDYHCWVEIDGYIYDTQLEWRFVYNFGRTQYLWSFYHMLDTTDTHRYRK